MARLRVLIWVQAVLGVILTFGLFLTAAVLRSERYAVGLMGVGVVWLLGYVPLRSRVARLSPEERQEADRTIPWAPKALGIAQFLSPAFVLFSPSDSLTLVADLGLFGAIALYVLACSGLNLEVNRTYWGLMMAIVGFGVAWNVIAFILLVSGWGYLSR